LTVASLILSLQQYAGDPIDCKNDGTGLEQEYLDSHCFIMGTYTVFPTRKNMLLGTSNILKKGENHMGCNTTKGPDEEGGCWHHAYYQWVGLMLIFQAGCFYFPRYLWTIWEQGKVQSLVSGLDKKAMVKGLQTDADFEDGQEDNVKVKKLVNSFRDTRGDHNNWAIKYYVVELMNLFNIVLQYILTDRFLGHQFHKVAVWGMEADIHESVLPIVTRCEYDKSFGSGGEREVKNPLCVLPLNMINQKLYTAFYIWLGVLFTASALLLIIRISLVTSTAFRGLYLKFFYGLYSSAKHGVNLDDVVNNTSHGDFLLLTFIFDNVNSIVGFAFLKKCAEEDWNTEFQKNYRS